MDILALKSEHYTEAAQLFAEAFSDDQLFVMTFPDKKTREIQTKIMYDFVVHEMVPGLNLKLVGVFDTGVLTGCMIYTTTENYDWDEDMNIAVEKMREISGNDRIRMIGEYATLQGFDPGVPHFYGNELAVKKEFRNKGIGKALCQFLISECEKSAEAKGIIIDTANDRNITLYEKMGWVLNATLPFYDIKKYFLWRNS